MIKNQAKNGADHRAKIVFYSFLLFCCSCTCIINKSISELTFKSLAIVLYKAKSYIELSVVK